MKPILRPTDYHPEPCVHATPAVFGISAGLAAAALMAAMPFTAFAQLDDFNDGNDTSPPPAWLEYNPILTGTWSFPGGNSYRIQSATSPDPGTYGQGRAGSVRPISYTNFYLAADLVGWDDSIHQVVGVLARVNTLGAGTTSGYMFTHDRGNPLSATSGDMDIVRLDHEGAVNLPTTGSDSIHFDPSKQYRIEFVGLGTNFTGRVYELPNLLIPVVEITAADDTYASGPGGLVVANNAVETGYTGPADATFDNFLAAVGAPNLFDNFNDGDDTNPPPAWERYNPIQTGAWSFPGTNTYRLQSAPSPDPGTYGQGRAGSLKPGNFTNFYVAADVVAWDDTIHQVFGVLARVTSPGPGTTLGYMFTYDRGNPSNPTGGDMDIVRLDNEVAVNLPTTGTDSIHLEPGKQYRFAFSGVGDSLTGQVYELPNTLLPVLTISTSDPSYPSGSSGLVVANNATESGYDGPADATFDNFLNTTGEPRLATDTSTGVLMLTWPAIPFTLQVSPSMTSPAWTPVTSGITQAGDQLSYPVSESPSPRFYRLAYP